MKKIYSLLTFLSFLMLTVTAQDWKVYDAKLMPDADPLAFIMANQAGILPTVDIIANPADDGDSLLFFTIGDQGDRYMWRYNFPTAQENLTLVARFKGLSDTMQRVMEIDFQFNGARERLFIHSNGGWELKQMGLSGTLPASTLDWHLYRITMLDSVMTFYLDENPEPIASVKTTSASTQNYFRWGDGDGNKTMGFNLDWLIWDESGAYAPGEGTAIPDSLVATVPNWDVYDAKLLPDLDPHAFTPSNPVGIPDQEIIGNPLDPTDSLLKFVTHPAGNSYMWRYNLPSLPLGEMTLVARIKGASDTLSRTMEFDFHYNDLRERLYIRNNGVWNFNQAGVNGNLTVNPQGWHIYRIARTATEISWYLDENPVPVSTVALSTAVSPNQYFRWGDGNSSSSLGAYIDWIIWDTTGAYAPNRGNAIPDTLITFVESSDATLDSLGSDVGTFNPEFHPDSLVYTLTVPLGTTSLTLTAVANDPNAEVTGDGLVSVIPDTVTITVTAEDGFEREYIVQIVEDGTDATLSSLTVDVGTLVPAFNPATYVYDLRVPETTTSITVTAVTNDPAATLEGDGEFTGIPGNDTITVTAQEGNSLDYVIRVAFMSSDANLASLVPSAGTLDPAFDPDVVTYTLEVPYSTVSVMLTATASDPLSEVDGDGTYANLPRSVTITVTAEDGTTKEYTVDITLAPNSLISNAPELLSIYPNPADTRVTLKLGEQVTTLEIYSFTGNLVEKITVHSQVVNLDIADYAEGIYLIKVNAAQGTRAFKLIVE